MAPIDGGDDTGVLVVLARQDHREEIQVADHVGRGEDPPGGVDHHAAAVAELRMEGRPLHAPDGHLHGLDPGDPEDAHRGLVDGSELHQLSLAGGWRSQEPQHHRPSEPRPSAPPQEHPTHGRTSYHRRWSVANGGKRRRVAPERASPWHGPRGTVRHARQGARDLLIIGGVLLRIFLSSALGLALLVAAPASAQTGPVPPPPAPKASTSAASPEVAEVPPPEPIGEPIMPPLGGARLRFSIGGQVLAIDGDRARGFDQWENLGLDKPKVALRANLELRWRLGDVVRLGAATGLEWTRQADDGDDLPLGDSVRETALRTGWVEGVLMLGTTNLGGPTFTTDLGLRLAAGGGLASWVWNDQADRAGLHRVSAAFDISFLWGHDTASGIGCRVGWSHVRTGELGPLDLRFDLSGPFLDLGYVHGW